MARVKIPGNNPGDPDVWVEPLLVATFQAVKNPLDDDDFAARWEVTMDFGGGLRSFLTKRGVVNNLKEALGIPE